MFYKIRLLIILSFPLLTFGQKEANIYPEKTINGHNLFIDNPDDFTITIILDKNEPIKNLEIIGDKKEFKIVPPNTKHFLLWNVMKLDSTKIASASFKLYKADPRISEYDENYSYDLPFSKGELYKISQGYNGSFSHKNKNAIDFNMPIGTKILASRDGIVTYVKQDSDEGCPTKECEYKGNSIEIRHSDGTFAAYGHIKFKGAKVKEGDLIKKGDLLGWSGNTGWSSGPHLHFICYYVNMDGNIQSIKTLFKIDKGKKSTYLQEGELVKKKY